MGTGLRKPETSKDTHDGFMDLHGQKGLPFSVSSMQGWKRTMEDAYIAKPNLERSYDVPEGTSLYAVFDGHGGKEVALFCEKYYIEALLNLNSFKVKRYEEALTESFYELDKMIDHPEYAEELRVMSGKGEYLFSKERANGDVEEDKIYQEETRASFGNLVQSWDNGADLNNKDVENEKDNTDNDLSRNHTIQPRFTESFDIYLPTHAGTTACIVLIIEGKIYVANAGDSRAVLCRDKKAYPLSFDHKPLDTRERNRIEAAGGWVSNMGRVCDNLNLSRCVGDLKYKQNKSLKPAEQIISAEPDVEVTEIAEKDLFLVVASDGVWDVMTSDEMINFISKSLVTSAKHKIDPSFLIHNATEEIFDICITSDPNEHPMGSDNMTVIIVCLRPLKEIISAFGHDS